jgi:hypothetical protein
VFQHGAQLDLHINPRIGSVRLAELSVPDVRKFRTRLLADGRSAAMAKKIVAALGAILADAMASGQVARNSRTRESGRSRWPRS